LSLFVDLSDRTLLNPEFSQHLLNSLVGLKLPVGYFRVLMQLSPESDNLFKQCFIHLNDIFIAKIYINRLRWEPHAAERATRSTGGSADYASWATTPTNDSAWTRSSSERS
jgi:hypothetical protein